MVIRIGRFNGGVLGFMEGRRTKRLQDCVWGTDLVVVFFAGWCYMECYRWHWFVEMVL